MRRERRVCGAEPFAAGTIRMNPPGPPWTRRSPCCACTAHARACRRMILCGASREIPVRHVVVMPLLAFRPQTIGVASGKSMPRGAVLYGFSHRAS